MKKLLLILLGLSLMALLFVGCGDDETTTAPTRARAVLFAQGYAYLDSSYSNTVFSLNSYVEFFNLDAGARYVDSANLSGNTVNIRSDDSYYWVYGDGYHWFSYNDTSDQRFATGDTVNLDMYYSNIRHRCMVKLIDRDVAPNVFLPTHQDTSNLGIPISFVWNSVPHAEWYAIQQRYWHDSSGSNIYTRSYWGQADTAFTISGANLIQNGRLDVYVVAGTGPLPGVTDGNNIAGDLIDGNIYSYTRSVWNRTYIGTGTPGAPANDEINDSEDIAGQIMFELTGIKPPANIGSTDRPIQ